MYLLRFLRRLDARCPLVALFALALSGTICLLSLVDLPLIAGRVIGSLNGKQTGASVAWLKSLPHPAGLAAIGFTLLVLGTGLVWKRDQYLDWVSRLAGSTPATGYSRKYFFLVLGATGFLVLGQYWPTLVHGYFRYDDFEIMAVAANCSLSEAVWMVHGDHFMPLNRIFAFTVWNLFGVSALPYNFVLLLCFAGVAISGCLLLTEFGVAWPAQFVFLVLMLCWSPWAEFLGGYFSLTEFTLMVLFNNASIWFYLRWRGKHKGGYAFLAVVCAVAACLTDIAGWYAPAALGVFLGLSFLQALPSEGWKAWARAHRHLLLGLGLALGAALAWTSYCYEYHSPGNFMSMGGIGRRSAAQVLMEWWYLLSGGLALSLGLPYLYARLPYAILIPLMMIASGVVGMAAWCAFRLADRQMRFALCGIAVVVLGTGLEVNLARRAPVTNSWGAHHLCAAYVWFCLLIATAWYALWLRASLESKRILAQVTLVALCIFILLQKGIGVFGMAVDYPPIGYEAHIRDARERRAAVQELGRWVLGPLTLAPQQRLSIPNLDGQYIWQNPEFRSLAKYDFSAYRLFLEPASSRVTLLRNPPMQYGYAFSATTVPRLRDAVSPAFLDVLGTNAELQNLYFADTPLKGSLAARNGAISLPNDLSLEAEEIAPEPDGSVTFSSSGRGALLLKRGPWDPEVAPQLRLAVERTTAASAADIPVEITFVSSFGSARPRSRLEVRCLSDSVTEVDLRQLYLFSLSHTVTDLRVVFLQPGRYRLWLADVAPLR